MLAGERMPLVAPVGSPFLVWSSEKAIESWITRHLPPRDHKTVKAWRHALELTRKRGYQVMLRAPNTQEIGADGADGIAPARARSQGRSTAIREFLR
jgi:DNA-binding IclR family transcriptional regulator